MKIEAIAAVCHEANRRYCKEIGDDRHKPWEEAPWWQRQSAIAGVMFIIQHPKAPASRQHEEWVKYKIEAGWKYGPLLNEEEKTHPDIRLYEDLSDQQKVKDRLFRSIVLALTQGDEHAYG